MLKKKLIEIFLLTYINSFRLQKTEISKYKYHVSKSKFHGYNKHDLFFFCVFQQCFDNNSNIKLKLI